MSSTRTILLVEDEVSITEPLTAALEREGWATHVTASAREAPGLVTSTEPDLVLLDVMLEDGSGFDVCREIRQTSRVPIIMLTARGEELDRIIGLELGADDYVVKPFSARELIARRCGARPMSWRRRRRVTTGSRSATSCSSPRCGGSRWPAARSI